MRRSLLGMTTQSYDFARTSMTPERLQFRSSFCRFALRRCKGSVACRDG